MDITLELGIAAMMVLLTIAFHGAALLGLSRLLDRVRLGGQVPTLNPSLTRGAITTTIVSIGLLAISTAEIWAYALLYVAAGAIGDLRSAVYFSTITYAAVGYSDAFIAENWKLVGAIEGINGVLLLGWSVAFLVSRMPRLTSSRSRASTDSDRLLP